MDKLKPCPFCGGEIKVCRGIEPEITGILCKECKAMIRWEIHMNGQAVIKNLRQMQEHGEEMIKIEDAITYIEAVSSIF